ncbi:hypothetical protein BGX23_010439 [Mortierella sp. AD031]|nr:hypothetical protein BGX23_010439 [Mortierella sp. AD031]
MAARNPGKEYTEFQEQVLITSNGDQQVNAFDIYCPVEACRCKLLLAKAATLVQREKSKLTVPQSPGATVSTINDDENDQQQQQESAVAATGTTTDLDNKEKGELQTFWKVADMMAFENIGFSKMLPNGTQFLSCADCDTGPLGYHESKVPRTEKEYLVALNRVRYHDRS